jgi:4-amino-4-deoxy-L-arabinose transferase-like glycosyltransferase
MCFSSTLSRLFSTHKFHLSMIILLSSIILFANLHKGDLSGYDDPLYAHEGKQLLITGDWWSIRLNGALNFEYPPMFIWLEALSMKIFGISDFAAKFPSALAGLLTIILVFCIARELSEEFWLPICSAWVLMLSQYYMKYAMRAMTDAPFTFLFILSLFLYIKGLKRPKYLILCGLAIGSGVLTRSVIGFIPVGIILGHQIITRHYQRPPLRYLLGGLLIALLLPFTWYFSQYLLHGDRFVAAHYSFVAGKVNSQRSFDVWRFIGGLLAYPRFLLQHYWPWLPFMVAGLIIQVRRMVRHGDRLAELLVVWVTLVVLPFSLVEFKVLRYIVPAFPAFSIMSATPFAGWLSKVRKDIYLQLGYLALSLGVICIAAFPKPLMRGEDMRSIAPIVDAHAAPNQRVMMFSRGEAYRDYHINQLLWYSNRFYTRLTESGKLVEALRADGTGLFIVDIGSYQELVANSGVKVEVLIQTRNFVCFRTVADISCDKLRPPDCYSRQAGVPSKEV